MTTDTYQQAIELIRKDQTANAIELLLQHAHYFQVFQRTKLILLSARLKRLERQKIKGIIDPGKSDYQLRRNQINDDLLQWLELTQNTGEVRFSWLRWAMISTSLVGLLAYQYFTQSPADQLWVDSVSYQEEQLSISLYRPHGTPESLDLFFSVPPADSNYLLVSDSLEHMEVSNMPTHRTLVGDYREWHRRQGIKVSLADPGWYEIKVPLYTEDPVDLNRLSNYLDVYPSGGTQLLQISGMAWYQYFYFGIWPRVFLIASILTSVGFGLSFLHSRLT